MVAAQEKNLDLGARIRAHIQVHGPLDVESFHRWALSDAEAGYYRTQSVLGPSGDFLTAPEISSFFGELVGGKIVATWEAMRKNLPVALCELGPGRGLLMQDILRVAAKRPKLFAQLNIHFIETHPRLREAQRARLEEVGFPMDRVIWHEDFPSDGFADGLLFCVANEFFDVLPAQQYVRRGEQWTKRAVTVNAEGVFAFCELPGGVLPGTLPTRYLEGKTFEHSAKAHEVMRTLVTRVARNGGGLFLCDYGYEASDPTAQGFSGDSWQALYKGEPVSPLQHAGKADLSFHVDFGALRALANQGGLLTELTTQRAFLLSHGLGARLEQKKAKTDAKQRARLEAEALRLTHPLQMGTLFKVLWAETSAT